MTFTCTAEDVDDAVVLVVHGELDLHTAPELTHVARGVVAGATSRLVVDLSGVTFMDCSGVTALLAVRHGMVARGGQFAVEGANASVGKLLRLTGVGGFFAA